MILGICTGQVCITLNLFIIVLEAATSNLTNTNVGDLLTGLTIHQARVKHMDLSPPVTFASNFMELSPAIIISPTSRHNRTKRQTTVELFCQSTMSRSIITGMFNHSTVNTGQKD